MKIKSLKAIHIGRIKLPELIFEGNELVYRPEATDTVLFLGERHVKVNNDNCYIKETEFKKLFCLQ